MVLRGEHVLCGRSCRECRRGEYCLGDRFSALWEGRRTMILSRLDRLLRRRVAGWYLGEVLGPICSGCQVMNIVNKQSCIYLQGEDDFFLYQTQLDHSSLQWDERLLRSTGSIRNLTNFRHLDSSLRVLVIQVRR